MRPSTSIGLHRLDHGLEASSGVNHATNRPLETHDQQAADASGFSNPYTAGATTLLGASRRRGWTPTVAFVRHCICTTKLVCYPGGHDQKNLKLYLGYVATATGSDLSRCAPGRFAERAQTNWAAIPLEPSIVSMSLQHVLFRGAIGPATFANGALLTEVE